MSTVKVYLYFDGGVYLTSKYSDTLMGAMATRTWTPNGSRQKSKLESDANLMEVIV